MCSRVVRPMLIWQLTSLALARELGRQNNALHWGFATATFQQLNCLIVNYNLKKKKKEKETLNADQRKQFDRDSSLTIVQNANHLFLQNFKFWMSASINMIFSEFFDLFFFLLSSAFMRGRGGGVLLYKRLMGMCR